MVNHIDIYTNHIDNLYDDHIDRALKHTYDCMFGLAANPLKHLVYLMCYL